MYQSKNHIYQAFSNYFSNSCLSLLWIPLMMCWKTNKSWWLPFSLGLGFQTPMAYITCEQRQNLEERPSSSLSSHLSSKTTLVSTMQADIKTSSHPNPLLSTQKPIFFQWPSLLQVPICSVTYLSTTSHCFQPKQLIPWQQGMVSNPICLLAATWSSLHSRRFLDLLVAICTLAGSHTDFSGVSIAHWCITLSNRC